MFIRKDEQMSHASPSRRGGWDGGSRRRAPRNWYKVVRVLLYALIGLLGGVAALAAVALFLDHNAGMLPPAERPPAPVAADTAPPAPDLASPAPPAPPSPSAAAGLPPVAATPLPPPSAAVPAAPPSAAPVAPAAPEAQPDPAALEALQQQLREANSTLSGLRAEAEALRRTLADVRQTRRAPPTAATPAAPAAGPPASPPPPAAPAPDVWADAERTIQSLTQQHAAAPPPAPRSPERTAAAVPPPAAGPSPPPAPAPADLAANAPMPPPSGPRPRVFLHYPAGSAGGLQAATDIAQRLLFSDFAYADTRSTTSAPADSVIRYFYPEDAPAASRLAALLGDGSGTFRIEDDTAHPGRQTPGMLDVWIGR